MSCDGLEATCQFRGSACFQTAMPDGNNCRRMCLRCSRQWFNNFARYADSLRGRQLSLGLPTTLPIHEVRVFVIITQCGVDRDKVFSLQLPLTRQNLQPYWEMVDQYVRPGRCQAVHFTIMFDLGNDLRPPQSVIDALVNEQPPTDPMLQELFVNGARFEYDSNANVLGAIFDDKLTQLSSSGAESKSTPALPVLYLTLRRFPESEYIKQLRRLVESLPEADARYQTPRDSLRTARMLAVAESSRQEQMFNTLLQLLTRQDASASEFVAAFQQAVLPEEAILELVRMYRRKFPRGRSPSELREDLAQYRSIVRQAMLYLQGYQADPVLNSSLREAVRRSLETAYQLQRRLSSGPPPPGLVAQLDDVKQQLRTREQENQAITAQLDNLNRVKNMLEQALAQPNNDVEAANVKYNSFRVMLHMWKAINQKFSGRALSLPVVDQYQAALWDLANRLQAQLQQLQLSKAGDTERLNALIEDNRRKAQKYAALQQASNQLVQQILTQTSVTGSGDASLQTLQRASQVVQQARVELDTGASGPLNLVEAVKFKLQNVNNAQITQYLQALEAQAQELRQAQANVAKLESDNTKREAALGRQAAALHQALVRQDRDNENRLQQQRQLADCLQKYEELKRQTSEANFMAQAELSAVRAELASHIGIADQLTQVNASLAESQEAKSRQSAEITVLQQQVQQLTESKNVSAEEIISLTQRLRTLSQSSQDNRQKALRLAEELKAVTSQQNDSRELEDAKQQIEDLEEQLMTLQWDTRGLQGNLERTTEELKKTREEAAEAETKYNLASDVADEWLPDTQRNTPLHERLREYFTSGDTVSADAAIKMLDKLYECLSHGVNNTATLQLLQKIQAELREANTAQDVRYVLHDYQKYLVTSMQLCAGLASTTYSEQKQLTQELKVKTEALDKAQADLRRVQVENRRLIDENGADVDNTALQNCQDQVTNLQSTVKQLEEQLSQLYLQRETYASEARTQQNRYKQLEKEMADLQARSDNCETKLAHAVEQYQQAETSNEELNSIIETRYSRGVELQNSRQQELEALQQQLKSAQTQLQTQQQQIEALTARN